MKKVVIFLMALLAVLIVLIGGCVDYKASQPPQAEESGDQSLVDEIAAIERELSGAADQNAGERDSPEVPPPAGAEEEVVLPELGEEPEELVTEEELEVITVRENEVIKLNVKVTDPDQDSVTYSFSKPLDKNGGWKTNYGDAGEYIATITATDGKLSTEKKVKLVVERVNVPPVIEPVQDILVAEGEVINFEPQVSDPNKDQVTVTVSDPLKTGTFQTDHTSAGEYLIRVTASDGELESQTAFKLAITDVNVPPEVAGLSDLTVKEGEVVEIKPSVTDLDGDQVKVTISDPVGDDGEWQTSFTSHGEYVITVTADDGKERVVKTVKVTVEDLNMPPVFEDVYVEVQ